MSDATKIPYDRLPDETDTAFLARAIMTLARVTEEKGGSIVTELATLARVAEEQGDAIATELGKIDCTLCAVTGDSVVAALNRVADNV
jgi:hypothetical protein